MPFWPISSLVMALPMVAPWALLLSTTGMA